MSNELTVSRETFSKLEKPMQEAGFNPEQVKREISFAIQIINKSSQLQDCHRDSILSAILNVANIGLTLNPAAKEAYLIPRYNSAQRRKDCVLEPGYIGLVKLLTDAGSVKSVVCQLVYDGDTFNIDLANNVNPAQHFPELNRAKRGEIKGAYALATLIDNSRQIEYMSIDEINEIRGRSETYKAFNEGKVKSCTWVSDYGEMARKTVIKRIYKYLPRTERMQKIDEAIEQDNKDFGISDGQVTYIENLLRSSTLEQRQRDALEMEIPVMTAGRAGEVITMLQNNQQIAGHHN